MADIEKAIETLLNTDSTCVICKGETLLKSDKRGVAPLLGWLESGVDVSGASAADKVVGNAAAYLYVLMNVKTVYAIVISEVALETLKKYQISVTYEKLVKAIKNRTNDGYCPMETAVKDASNPEEALALIKEKLRSLLSNGNNN